MPEQQPPVDLLTPAFDAVINRAEALQRELGREPTEEEFAAIIEAVDEEFSDDSEDPDAWFD